MGAPDVCVQKVGVLYLGQAHDGLICQALAEAGLLITVQETCP